MNPRVAIRRTVKLPDPTRVARCQRAPELGPRVLFFSGGSALGPLSRALKEYTHNSVHLITPFDSGGSSASLRDAFSMLSIGDLRNRLVALADESSRGNPDIYRLFCYRMPKDSGLSELRQELDTMIAGRHPLISAVPEPMRQIIQTHLRFFRSRATETFDLRGANIGNLLLTGGYLSNERNIRATLFLFSKLLEVRGMVLPTADSTAHLAAELDDGQLVAGQHLLTGKGAAPPEHAVRSLSLVDDLRHARPVTVGADPEAISQIRKADLICYPMGSFYTSVMANLLPAGIGRAVALAGCPKVYIPNMGHDPEQRGLPVHEAVERLLQVQRRDAGSDVPASALLNLVLVDMTDGSYESTIDLPRIEGLGVTVVDIPLTSQETGKRGVAARRLTEVLLTLSQ